MKNESAGKKTNEILKDILKELKNQSFNNSIGTLTLVGLALTQIYYLLFNFNISLNVMKNIFCFYSVLMVAIICSAVKVFVQKLSYNKKSKY